MENNHGTNPFLESTPSDTLETCAQVLDFIGNSISATGTEGTFQEGDGIGAWRILRGVQEALQIESKRIPEMTGPYRQEMTKAAQEHIASFMEGTEGTQ